MVGMFRGVRIHCDQPWATRFPVGFGVGQAASKNCHGINVQEKSACCLRDDCAFAMTNRASLARLHGIRRVHCSWTFSGHCEEDHRYTSSSKLQLHKRVRRDTQLLEMRQRI